MWFYTSYFLMASLKFSVIDLTGIDIILYFLISLFKYFAPYHTIILFCVCVSFTVFSTVFWFGLYIVSEFPQNFLKSSFIYLQEQRGSNAEIRVLWRRAAEKQSDRYNTLRSQGSGELY